jgi:thiamine kinase-like enzyme
MIVAGGVDRFDGGWGSWHLANTIKHATALAAGRPDLAVDVDRCAAVVAAAGPRFDARPMGLVHTDANPWNVLVTASSATWVDWEFSWWADPLYDFIRITFARKYDVGPVPPAFFAGYGDDPRDDPLFDVMALGFHLWMGNEARAAILPDQLTYLTAERYLKDLPHHLARLESHT